MTNTNRLSLPLHRQSGRYTTRLSCQVQHLLKDVAPEEVQASNETNRNSINICSVREFRIDVNNR
jgi:hypothetical protein